VLLHKTIKKVGEDVASLHYNTAISAMMICLRELEEKDVSQEDFETFLKLLAPFAPFMTEEIWRETFGRKTSIHREAWPEYDSSIIREETVTLVLQVNSRTRGTVTAAADVSEPDATALALASESVKMYLAGKEPKKIIYVPGKLVNIVV
jgi:leucyl-tRNA synthetase